MVRKAKTYLEFNVMKTFKVNKKVFCNRSKRKIRESVSPLLNGAGALVTEHTGKAEVLNGFFASVSTSKTSLQKSQALETRGKVWSKESLSLVEEDQIRQY